MFRTQNSRPRRLRSPAGPVTVLVLGVAFAVLPAVAAQASTTSSASIEAAFLSDTNVARAANGLPRYSVSSDLVSVARTHSRAMSSSQTLYHNASLTTAVTNWQAVGENVGDGPTESDLQTAFMQSPEHRSNILDRDFTQVGVGVAIDSHGTIWVTLDFRQPLSSATTTTAPRHAATHPAAVVRPPTHAVAVVHRATAAIPVKHQPTRRAIPVVASAHRPSVATDPIAPRRDLVAMSAFAPTRVNATPELTHLGILFRPEIVLILLALALIRVHGRTLAVRRSARTGLAVPVATG